MLLTDCIYVVELSELPLCYRSLNGACLGALADLKMKSASSLVIIFRCDRNPPLPAPGTARPYFARTLNAATVLTLAPIGIALRSTKKSELWFEYGNGIPLARASANNFGGAIPTRMKT